MSIVLDSYELYMRDGREGRNGEEEEGVYSYRSIIHGMRIEWNLVREGGWWEMEEKGEEERG